jgi:transposase
MGKIITDFSSVTTVGLDLAKHVFQVHCVDASGRVVVASRSGATSYWSSSLRCLLASSGSRHAVRRITSITVAYFV